MKAFDLLGKKLYRQYKAFAFDFVDRLSYQDGELVLDHAPLTHEGERFEPLIDAFTDFLNEKDVSKLYKDYAYDFSFDEFKSAIVEKMYQLAEEDFHKLNESAKNRIIENDSVVSDKDSILNSDDMEAEAEEILTQLPDDGIQGKHDVDELAESMKDIFWKAYVTAGTKYAEAFNLKSFITDYIAKNGKADVESIAAALPNEGTGKYYKNHADLLAQKIAQVTGKNANEIEEKPAFNPNNLTNDLARELANIPEENSIISAADSAQDKFDTLRSVARTVLQGKGIKHHAFIYGDAGVGKCASYEEKIPVKMDDAVAAAFEEWLQSHQK